MNLEGNLLNYYNQIKSGRISLPSSNLSFKNGKKIRTEGVIKCLESIKSLLPGEDAQVNSLIDQVKYALPSAETQIFSICNNQSGCLQKNLEFISIAFKKDFVECSNEKIEFCDFVIMTAQYNKANKLGLLAGVGLGLSALALSLTPIGLIELGICLTASATSGLTLGASLPTPENSPELELILKAKFITEIERQGYVKIKNNTNEIFMIQHD